MIPEPEVKVTGILPILPDGRVVLQRRDYQADVSKGLLALFDGHILDKEDPLEGAKRELAEETSLDIGQVALRHIATFTQLPSQFENTQKPARLDLFFAGVPSDEFSVFEGIGKEVMTVKEALKREDLTISLRNALNELNNQTRGT